MVIMGKDIPKRLFKIGKIDDHAVFDLSFDRELYFVGVAVQGSALCMTGQKMGAVGVFGHTKFHGVRIAHE